MAFSNSRLSSFRRCRLRYHWSYNQNISQPKGVGLRRGSAGHAALGAYYSGSHVSEAISYAWAEFQPTYEDSLKEMLKLDTVLDRYFKWCVTQDNWRVHDVERTVEANYKGLKLMGIWDLLVEIRGGLYIVDHKFQKSHSFAHLEVDTQVTHYLALAKLARVPVKGMLYNIINLSAGKNSDMALRQIVSRSDRMLEAYLEGLIPVTNEISLMDAGVLSIYPNWTKDCCWDCGYYRKCIDQPYRQEGEAYATSSFDESGS